MLAMLSTLLSCTTLMITLLMYPGGGAQRHARPLDQDLATGKVPPAWSSENDAHYSFRVWLQDLTLWASATDVPEVRQASTVGLRLTGVAKTVVREMQADTLTNGVWQADANGVQVQVRTGLQQLVRELSRRFAPLEQEAQLQAVSDFMLFKRSGSEPVDDVVTRFEIARYRASTVGGMQMNEVVLSWLILTHLHVPLDKWPVLLFATQGQLPSDQAQYDSFILYIRRNGHLYDRGQPAHTIKQPYYVDQTLGGVTVNSYYNDGSTDGSQSQQWWDTMPWSHNTATQVYHAASPSSPFDSFAQSHQQEADQFAFLQEPDTDSSSDSDVPGHQAADLTDMLYHTVNDAGAELFVAYKHAKKRWRSFQGKTTRTTHRFKKVKRFTFKKHSKGKGKGKYHQQAPSFFSPPAAQDGFSFVEQQAFFKGSGKGFKGGAGSGRLNPTGPDGKRMLCSICSSDSHFRAQCPKASASGTFMSAQEQPAAAQPVQSAGSSQSSVATRNAYQFAGLFSATEEPDDPNLGSFSAFTGQVPPRTRAAPQFQASRITFADGSPSQELESLSMLSVDTSRVNRRMTPADLCHFGAWAYHTQVRLVEPAREGLLIDTGAVANLAGESWIRRVEGLALIRGRGSQWRPLPKALRINGVGAGSNSCEHECIVPLALSDGTEGTFTCPVIGGSEIPALMGLDSLTN